MKLFRKLLARNRLRKVRRILAENPSPRSYALLAHEYALLGLNREVVRVCEEGLESFPGSRELVQFRERARRMDREKRLSQVKRELSEAPRPALWQEMCEILLEMSRPGRAEEVALQWIQFKEDDESRAMLARVRLERYLADRSREQGMTAKKALENALNHAPSDPRLWHLKLRLFTKIGAWDDARQCVARLLQLEPGSPELEARFRTLNANAEGAPTPDRALMDVERTGHFADEEVAGENPVAGGDVRPILRSLAAETDIHASVYVRGSTALVQGPKGATAERMARAVRSILASGRTSGRRLGLGQIFQIQIEGKFGTLSIAPGEMDAGAIWSEGHLGRARESTLMGLAGLNASMSEVAP